MPKRLMLHMHQIRDFIDDRDKFYRVYMAGEKAKHYSAVEKAFGIGRAVDFALKEHYTGKDENVFNSPDFPLLNDDQKAMVIGMVNGYLDHYKDEYFHTFSTNSFQVPVGDFMIYASPDLKAYDYEDGFWIIEIKTGVKRETLDFQTMTYLWASYRWNFKIPVGVLKRTITKPTIKQKKNETAKDFQKRLVMVYADKPEKYYKSGFEYTSKKQILDFEKYLLSILDNLSKVMKSRSEKKRYSFWKRSDVSWK